jgi:23S rRNA (guanosine2251-2'-O)-methyltransferase
VILYGRNPVREALRGVRGVRRVWATEAAQRGEEWLRETHPERAGAEELERMCGTSEHQGVCAEVERFPYADAERLLDPPDAIVVCLDEVQDPQNLGAVCRVAESAGASGVVIPHRRSAEVTPAACKAAAGAVEHLPVARVRNLSDWLVEAKERGAWVYGAARAPGAVSYDAPDYSGRTVLVLGSEGRGLRPRVAATCDCLVELPQHGRIGSLNVATATAALLYAILHLRRRRLDKGP